jgi:protein-S-isoprenylcysteine O-methyltransferase Ste14
MSMQRADDTLPRAAVLRAHRWRGLALAFARRRLAHWRQLDVASGQAVRLPRKVILCDLAERLIVTSVFGSFAYRLFVGFAETVNALTVLLFLAEMLPFIYIVLRAPSASLSQKPIDWGFGILGSVTPLLISPVPAEPIAPVVVCFVLMLGGLLIQLAAKIVLGRTFGIIAANRGVKVFGPYRFVRHPMYAGYTMTHIGFLLSMPLLINAALYASVLALQIVRIYREENILMQDARYRAFAARVRYRLLPGIF